MAELVDPLAPGGEILVPGPADRASVRDARAALGRSPGRASLSPAAACAARDRGVLHRRRVAPAVLAEVERRYCPVSVRVRRRAARLLDGVLRSKLDVRDPVSASALDSLAVSASALPRKFRRSAAAAVSAALTELSRQARPFLPPVSPEVLAAAARVLAVGDVTLPAPAAAAARRVLRWHGRLPDVATNDPMTVVFAERMLVAGGSPSVRAVLPALDHEIAAAPTRAPLDRALRLVAARAAPAQVAAAARLVRVPRGADTRWWSRRAALMVYGGDCTTQAVRALRRAALPSGRHDPIGDYYAALGYAALRRCGRAPRRAPRLMPPAIDARDPTLNRYSGAWLEAESACAIGRRPRLARGVARDVDAHIAAAVAAGRLRAEFDVISAYGAERLEAIATRGCAGGWYRPPATSG